MTKPLPTFLLAASTMLAGGCSSLGVAPVALDSDTWEAVVAGNNRLKDDEKTHYLNELAGTKAVETDRSYNFLSQTDFVKVALVRDNDGAAPDTMAFGSFQSKAIADNRKEHTYTHQYYKTLSFKNAAANELTMVTTNHEVTSQVGALLFNENVVGEKTDDNVIRLPLRKPL